MQGFHFRFFTPAALAGALILGMTSPVSLSAGSKPDQQGFVVAGTTSRPMLADASVELRVGTALFTGLTDASGRFAIQASCPASPDDLVYLIVKGGAAQSELQLARVLDGCGRIQALAGEQGRYRTGPVNPISTGLYAAMRWFAEREDGVAWPMTAPELLQVQYLLGGGRVATAAQAIAYWEAGLGSPPAGIDNTLDLVLDRFALSDYLARVKWDENPNLLREIARQVFWDPAHFRRPSAVADSASFATVCAELQQNCGELFRLQADGRLEFVNRFDASSGQWLDLGRQDQVFADALERRFGTLRTLAATPELDDFLWVSELPTLLLHPEFGLISAIRRTAATRARVRIVEASDLIPLLSVQYDTVQSFPEFPEIDLVEARDAAPSLHSAILDLTRRPDWAGPEAGEQWVLPLMLPELTPEFSPLTAVRVQFQSGASAVLTESGRELDWTFADQVLTLSSEELGQQRLYFIGQADGRHPVFFVDAAPGAEASRRIETSAGFRPATLAGAWQAEQVAGRYVGGFGFDNWLFTALPFVDPYFVFDLNADGSGLAGEVPAPDAPLNFGDEVSWSIDEQGGLVIRREFSLDFRQWRRWERLTDAQGSGDLYLRESTPLFVERDVDDPPDFADYRVNFYQLRPIPD